MSYLVISPQFNPYLNLAVEGYLLQRAAEGDESITLYLWRNARTVVIGQNQNPYAECNLEALQADGGYLTRRQTGGGAVYHDLGNLNFSFVAPQRHYDVRRHFNVISRALRRYDLETELSGRNDLLCQGRKCSGNAFARRGEGCLHHGTLLIRTQMDDLQRYLLPRPAKLQRHGVASIQSRVVNLSELAPSLTAEAIIPLLAEAFTQEYGGETIPMEYDQLASLPQVQALQQQLSSDEWLYGRWRQFQATRTAHFDWGEAQLSAITDSQQERLTRVQIASDSLRPDAIALAERLLTGASIHIAPLIPSDADGEQQQIVRDLFSLLYT